MKSILIIDDEKNILLLCRYILEKRDYNVTLVSSKEEAMKELRRAKYDLVVTDCTLGMYVGEDIIKEIKTKYPDTGVIVMSGYFHAEEIQECIRKGAYICLVKPFRHEDLLNCVDEYFGSLHAPAVRSRGARL
ncbi:MAG: response regulator [Elusimicrobia bacterium]|nr:response regulator [Elusimicrobiota bacterium]